MAIQIPMSLKTAQLTPVPFKPGVFTPQSADINILRQSYDSIDNRRRLATEAATKVDMSLEKMREELHNDDETNAWFEQYKQDTIQSLENAVQAGNYEDAILIGTRQATKSFTDAELQARIDSNKQYETAMQALKARADSGKISQATLRYGIKKNQYKFKPTIANGKITGNSPYQLDQPIYDELSNTEMTILADKLVHPDKYTNDWTEGNTSAEGTGYKKGGGYSRERLTPTQIKNSWEALKKADAQSIQVLYQQYYVQLSEYEDITNQLDKAIENNNVTEISRLRSLKADVSNELFNKNGGFVGHEQFARTKVYNLANQMGYNWITTSSTDVTDDYVPNTDTNPGAGGKNKIKVPNRPDLINTEGAGGMWNGGMLFDENGRRKTDSNNSTKDIKENPTYFNNGYQSQNKGQGRK